jgi:hypothetical protein
VQELAGETENVDVTKIHQGVPSGLLVIPDDQVRSWRIIWFDELHEVLFLAVESLVMED